MCVCNTIHRIIARQSPQPRLNDHCIDLFPLPFDAASQSPGLSRTVRGPFQVVVAQAADEGPHRGDEDTTGRGDDLVLVARMVLVWGITSWRWPCWGARPPPPRCDPRGEHLHVCSTAAGIIPEEAARRAEARKFGHCNLTRAARRSEQACFGGAGRSHENNDAKGSGVVTRDPRSMGRLRSMVPANRATPTATASAVTGPRWPAGGTPQAPGLAAPRPPGQALSWRGDGDGHPAPAPDPKGTLDAEAHAVQEEGRLLRKKHTGVWMRLVADQRNETGLSPRRVTARRSRGAGSGRRSALVGAGQPSRPKGARHAVQDVRAPSETPGGWESAVSLVSQFQTLTASYKHGLTLQKAPALGVPWHRGSDHYSCAPALLNVA